MVCGTFYRVLRLYKKCPIGRTPPGEGGKSQSNHKMFCEYHKIGIKVGFFSNMSSFTVDKIVKHIFVEYVMTQNKKVHFCFRLLAQT